MGKRDLKSQYAPKAERLLRVLLCNPGKKWKIKELALESAVSLLGEYRDNIVLN